MGEHEGGPKSGLITRSPVTFVSKSDKNAVTNIGNVSLSPQIWPKDKLAVGQPIADKKE